MNEIYYEQILNKTTTKKEFMTYAIAIFVTLVIDIGGLLLFGWIFLVPTLFITALAYFYISSHLSVDVEYTLFNQELEIAFVYNKAKRKVKRTIQINTCKVIAPSNSGRLQGYSPYKTIDCTSGTTDNIHYSLIVPHSGAMENIKIEPDKQLLEYIKIFSSYNFYEN